MSSSDSDDDCYGNLAQKLQKMKNRYDIENTKSSNFLNDSVELLNSAKKTDEPDKTGNESSTFDSFSEPASISQSLSKRRTRSSAKRSSEPDSTSDLPDINVSSSKRRRGCNSSQSSPSRPARGRGRGRRGTPSPRRGRRRGRGRSAFWWHQDDDQLVYRQNAFPGTSSMPVYAIGDADEVYDQSRGQQLFSTKKNEDVVVIEEPDTLDDNEELSVKVYWQSCEMFRFTIRKYQKLTQIFDYFIQKKNVKLENLYLTYNEKILKPNDTPDSIDYNIVKFIEGGIVNQSITQLVVNEKDTVINGIKLKFQCQNVKKPFELSVDEDETLSIAMMKCAEHFELPLEKLRFVFDGDTISGKNTAKELDLEGGECIDVKVLS